MSDEKTPGQAAYEAYEAHYEQLTGEPGASWEVERDDNRACWEAAAQAAIDWWHADRDLEPPREITASPSELAAARMVVAEMINHWQRVGATREEDDLIVHWRLCAGLDPGPGLPARGGAS